MEEDQPTHCSGLQEGSAPATARQQQVQPLVNSMQGQECRVQLGHHKNGNLGLHPQACDARQAEQQFSSAGRQLAEAMSQGSH